MLYQMLRKIEKIKTESDIKTTGTYSANFTQKDFSFRISTPKQKANKTRNLDLIESMKRTQGQFTKNFFDLRSQSETLVKKPEVALFSNRRPQKDSMQKGATDDNKTDLVQSQMLFEKTYEKEKPDLTITKMSDSHQLQPSTPTAIRTTKIKPIIMDDIKFKADGDHELLSTKRDQIIQQKVSLIACNPGLIKPEKDELAGKKYHKIKLEKFSFQWSHPLFKYDEKTADEELAKKEDDFDIEEQRAFCRHYDLKEDKYVWEECRIIGKYEEGRYIIYWTKSKQRKIVDRLNLRFAMEMEGEALEEAEKRFEHAMKKRHADIYNENLKSSPC